MTDELAKVREACEDAHREVWGVVGVVSDGFVAALAKRLQPKPSAWSVSEAEKTLAGIKAENARLMGRLDEIEKRLSQPKPEPPKKVWGVSDETAHRYVTESLRWCMAPESGPVVGLNAVASDIIRERPDLVAEDWERRYRNVCPNGMVKEWRQDLFPELDPE